MTTDRESIAHLLNQLRIPAVDSDANEARMRMAATVIEQQSAPVPMRLICPECSNLHVDEGDFATRPHHTHACQHCGNVWRPAIVATVGVQFLPGFKDGGAL